MGTDIYGGVEVRKGGVWVAAGVDVGSWRDYDAYGLLFGVRNYAGFEPVAASRGFPADAVLRPMTRYPEVHDHSWVTWGELAQVDWTGPAPRVDDRIHEYEVTEDGPVYRSKARSHGVRWRAVAGEDADPRGSAYSEGTEWRCGNTVWRVERLDRSEVLRRNAELRELLATMRSLAGEYGEDNVRLVVWFDS
ncbi:hypothetical protein AB0368_35995 [Actinoplanes sp. NPDC051475]|uniref:hypothetical protein n=1 Tax=Actinoplanes sp. NPDC051475 TaxID=3157225 RepID=UPI00344C2446